MSYIGENVISYAGPKSILHPTFRGNAWTWVCCRKHWALKKRTVSWDFIPYRILQGKHVRLPSMRLLIHAREREEEVSRFISFEWQARVGKWNEVPVEACAWKFPEPFPWWLLWMCECMLFLVPYLFCKNSWPLHLLGPLAQLVLHDIWLP